MNRAEVLQLLAMASVIDPRVSRRTDGEKSAMADAWCGILDAEMPFAYAVTVESRKAIQARKRNDCATVRE